MSLPLEPLAAEGKVLVWRTSGDVEPEMVEAIVLRSGCSLLVWIDPDDDLSALDEEDMRAAGWVRAQPLSDPDANRAGIAGSRRTSAAAALRVQPRTGTQRRRILDYITQHGPSTDEQIQRALDLSGNTERPRRVELVEGGWLEEIDKHGLTEHGPAIRWGLTTQARARLQGAA